jgi:hypothetical protein
MNGSEAGTGGGQLAAAARRVPALAAALDRWLRVGEMLDRAAIEEVLRRYYRGLDRFDEELMRSAFHRGAQERHGGWADGDAGEVCHRLLEAAGDFSRSHIHLLCNVTVRFESRTLAYSEGYLLAVSRRQLETGPADFSFYGRLLDTFAKRHGEWRITHRLLVKDFTRMDGVTGNATDPDLSLEVVGTRDRHDPSYRLFP